MKQTTNKQKQFRRDMTIFTFCLISFSLLCTLRGNLPLHAEKIMAPLEGIGRHLEYFICLMSGPIAGLYLPLRYQFPTGNEWNVFLAVGIAISYGTFALFLWKKKRIFMIPSIVSWILFSFHFNYGIYV